MQGKFGFRLLAFMFVRLAALCIHKTNLLTSCPISHPLFVHENIQLQAPTTGIKPHMNGF